ncbi:hypothetical protein BO82DRAFT_426237 [Aspergillus uvarum CBS 121591]|uniref:Uncharacterized protein n=1 Tax=Aspergillus uvarum CBS 121591 TaxID=1448315 RepID=A0A319BVW7_9EURO|nr:hypothetical protein BO82DRAFT_426237 [Aspergillus uvarum CBS 121591]PYH76367.1 hypothetical protein BO82DRAFT_426237 [Aspergillus uvarum CBS 121591]
MDYQPWHNAAFFSGFEFATPLDPKGTDQDSTKRKQDSKKGKQDLEKGKQNTKPEAESSRPQPPKGKQASKGKRKAKPPKPNQETWEIQTVLSIRTQPTPIPATDPPVFTTVTSLVARVNQLTGPIRGREAILKLRLHPVPLPQPPSTASASASATQSQSQSQTQSQTQPPSSPSPISAHEKEKQALTHLPTAKTYAPYLITTHRSAFTALAANPRDTRFSAAAMATAVSAEDSFATLLLLAMPVGTDCRNIQMWGNGNERAALRTAFRETYLALCAAGVMHTRPGPEHVIWDREHRKCYIVGLGNAVLGERDRVVPVGLWNRVLGVWGLEGAEKDHGHPGVGEEEGEADEGKE